MKGVTPAPAWSRTTYLRDATLQDQLDDLGILDHGTTSIAAFRKFIAALKWFVTFDQSPALTAFCTDSIWPFGVDQRVVDDPGWRALHVKIVFVRVHWTPRSASIGDIARRGTRL
jgi:hypothetical protein